jgi:hypothetical protein
MKNATYYVGDYKSYKSRTKFCNDDDNEEQEWEKGKKVESWLRQFWDIKMEMKWLERNK